MLFRILVHAWEKAKEHMPHPKQDTRPKSSDGYQYTDYNQLRDTLRRKHDEQEAEQRKKR